ncbi:hypothetical protein OG21DRAFT_1491900 [Imleria badia]|nr:hypothetical protein OG21DRAFT_1491900 [Imleria badia]
MPLPAAFAAHQSSTQEAADEGVVAVEVDLCQLLQAYQADQAGDEPEPLDCSRESLVFTNSIAVAFEELGPSTPGEGAGVLASLQAEASVSRTGWVGAAMKNTSDKEAMKQMLMSGGVWDALKGFKEIPYVASQPVLIFDRQGHLLCARGYQAPWLPESMKELDGLLKELVGSLPKRYPGKWGEWASNPRGNHIPMLLGWHRPYTKIPTRPEAHRLVEDRAAAFINSKLIQRITNFVCSMLRLYFPECAARFESAVLYWKKLGVEADFGLYFNFCANLPLLRSRVHATPHADRKNIAGGICALMAFHYRGKFNSHLRAWLVLWELGVVVELPVGVLLLYPSALFYHFNVDKADIVATDGARPNIADREQHPSWDDEAEGRGSLVWFNQASMIQPAELGYPTIGAAQAAGIDASTNFKEDASLYFAPPPPLALPLPNNLSKELQQGFAGSTSL